MMLTPAERKRLSRADIRRRLNLAPALIEAGRLGEWSENDVDAVDAAIVVLLADYAADVLNRMAGEGRAVTSLAVDPVPKRTLPTDSPNEDPQ